MADIAATSSTDITNERAGFISKIGSYFYGFQKVSGQPAFQRALPTIVAVLVTIFGLLAYFSCSSHHLQPCILLYLKQKNHEFLRR